MVVTISLVTVALVRHVRRAGLRGALLHGYTWSALAYLVFFWRSADNERLARTVDVAVAFSFLAYTAGFSVGHRCGRAGARRIMGALLPRPLLARPVSATTLVLFAQIPVLYAGWVLYTRTHLFGDLEAALFGLYSVRAQHREVWMTALNEPLFAVSLASVFYMRLHAVAERSRILTAVVWLDLLVLMATSVLLGSRSRILKTALTVVVAEVVLARGGRLASSRALAVSMAWLAAVGLAVFTTMVRSHVGDRHLFVARAREAVDAAEFLRGGGDFAVRGSVTDAVAFCLDYYSDHGFLYWHTPWSILTNVVPRRWWPDKPVAFGKLLGEAQGFPHDNPTSVAAGLAGEGYAAGGWTGVLLLSTAVGYAMGWVSGVAHWALLRAYHPSAAAVGFVLLLAPPYFVRGDVLSAYASTAPLILVPLVLRCAIGPRRRKAGSGGRHPASGRRELRLRAWREGAGRRGGLSGVPYVGATWLYRSSR